MELIFSLTGGGFQRDFAVLTFGLCVLLALLMHLGRHRLAALFPRWALRLALLFLSLQIIVLTPNFIIRKDIHDPVPEFLWNLDSEISIPSMVATIPLFLVGSLCLTILSSGKLSRLAWLYWFALCLSFTLMALMDFSITTRYPFGIAPGELFRPVGGLLAASTLFMILRSSTARQRLHLATLLGGLALWAMGAMLLDKILIQGQAALIPLEETLEIVGVLVALVGVAGHATAIAPTTPVQRSVIAMGALVTVLLSASIVHYHYPRYEPFLKGLVRPLDATIDDSLTLTGWTGELPQPGASAEISLWLYATTPPDYNFGFSIQLLDQENGSVIAAADKMSKGTQDTSKWKPGHWHTRSQTVHVSLPADIPAKRSFWLTLSFWQYEGNEALRPLPVTRSDHPLLGNSYIILDELVLPAPGTGDSQTDALAHFANGFVLLAASIPERAQASEALEVTFRWGTDSAGSEDWTQFLHFHHEESGSLWNVDQMPLGLRLPTRLWYAGLQSSEVWRFTIPADLQPGRYSIYSGLYRLSDLQRLGVTLADGTQPADARIPLGTIIIEG